MNTEEQNYISLQEAAQYCHYSQEYLSLRARQGKLKSVKFGRNWVTKKEWLDEYLERVEEYISLQEASKYCHYSQEYLSLRARQGKLRSVKFGRNWVTKKEWLEKYLKEVEEYNKNLKAKKIVPPLEKLLITQEPSLEIVTSKIRPVFTSPFVYAVIIIFVLIFAGIIFTPSYIQKITGGPQLAAISAQDILKYTFDTFQKYGQWLNENIKIQIAKLKTTYFFVSNFIKQKLSTKPTKEGIVVVPSTDKDEEMREKIKKSFSDEVAVEMKDKTWGIIKPIFRTPSEQEYLYIMVPIKN